MIAIDSSVIVAALRSIDERHEDAVRALQRAVDAPDGAIIPIHSLLETYAVITRMPPPHRMSPADAVVLLRKTFATSKLAPLSARSLWPLLDDLAGADLGGGLTYDAIILRAAEDAGATALLTLNPRDYERLSPRIAIRSPE
jgi:predicted nucleic acid-binding protein